MLDTFPRSPLEGQKFYCYSNNELYQYRGGMWEIIKNEGQKKSHSFIESIVNVVIGFVVSFVANLIVLPWFGFKVSVSSALGIGIIFTIISIVRSYILRRVFNKIMLRGK